MYSTNDDGFRGAEMVGLVQRFPKWAAPSRKTEAEWEHFINVLCRYRRYIVNQTPPK